MAKRGTPYRGQRPLPTPPPVKPGIAPSYQSRHGARYENHDWNAETAILVTCDCQSFVAPGAQTMADAQMAFVWHLIHALRISVRQS
jgi:hypothetical protein